MPLSSRLSLASCVLAGALALTLSACGDGGAAAGRADVTDVTHGKERVRAPAGELCQSQLGGFIGSMDSLRKRLAVGVTYDQYVDEVHGVRATYREIPIEAVQIDCLDAVGTPSEKAFNRYIDAANAWGECVSQLGCGSAAIEPVLQRRWRIGSHFLSEAQRGLRAMARRR